MVSIARSRRRSLAMLLSLGLPGLGELYAGRAQSALVTFASTYLLSTLGIAAIFAPLRGMAVLLAPLAIAAVAWIVVLVRAARAAGHAPDPYVPHAYNQWYWYLAAILVNLFLLQPTLVSLLRAHWIQAFRNPSAAMEPTLLVGDFIFASKRPSARIPTRNDIVILESPDGLTIVKRVAGLPGDTLTMTNGRLIRNGEYVPEPFTQSIDSTAAIREDLGAGRRWHVAHLVAKSVSASRTYGPNMRNWGPILVPRDSVFVLGDNRDNSYDSRFYGAIGIDRVRGKPLVVYFSVGHAGVRWARIGSRF